MYLNSIYRYFYEFTVPVESSSLKIEIARNCAEFETPPNTIALSSPSTGSDHAASRPLPTHHGSQRVGLEGGRVGIGE